LRYMPEKFFCLVLALGLAVFSNAAGAKSFSFIRDAEIENTIRTYGTPLFAQAGLTPSSVRVYIVNDSSLNAFVAGGQNIFINTGLLLAAETPNQLIGVIAHETGHISGGHLARVQDALRDASAQSILAFVLGAAAVVAGQGQAGGAIIGGGTQVAERTLLKYTRVQEAAADQAALRFLDQSGQSARGLLEFFEKLGDQEALLTSSQDPYVRTHPLSRDRVDTVAAHIRQSPNADKPDSPALVEAHARMLAKLTAFLKNPITTFRTYPLEDRSVAARYAHVIAFHKQNKTQQALSGIDELIAEEPNNPYFHELKGQVLLESGNPDAAVGPYSRAVELVPDESLLRAALGQAQVNASSDSYVDDAIENLLLATNQSPQEASGWRWLAMAYGRKGDVGMASLATAQRYLLAGRANDALGQAMRAEKLLPEGTPAHLRAQDIRQAAQTMLEKK
jgi:predicted Zn-dependent protease